MRFYVELAPYRLSHMNSVFTGILLFQMEHYSIKTDIITYYSLPNSTTLGLCRQEYEYAADQE